MYHGWDNDDLDIKLIGHRFRLLYPLQNSREVQQAEHTPQAKGILSSSRTKCECHEGIRNGCGGRFGGEVHQNKFGAAAKSSPF